MSEISDRNDQSMMDVELGRQRVSLKRFSVHLSGNTSGAHVPWVSKLKHAGQIEVNSPEDSDYILLFCPITSRVGTDISEALENIPDKPVILVVMHHTFSRDHVVSESRRQVSDPKVLLVVDTLFYEGRPLDCHHNETALDEIRKFLGVHAEVPSSSFIDCCVRNIWTIRIPLLAILVIVILLIILARLL